MNGEVTFRVSMELIREALAIPENCRIRNITVDPRSPNTFVFQVSGPDLPEWVEGAPPVEVEPLITADYDKRPTTWLTFDFRLPK